MDLAGGNLLHLMRAGCCPNAEDAGDNVSLLGENRRDPINYVAHAGQAAQITVHIAQIQPRHLNQTSGSTALNAIIASA